MQKMASVDRDDPIILEPFTSRLAKGKWSLKSPERGHRRKAKR